MSPLIKKDKETIKNENQLFQKKYGYFYGSEGVDESMLSMIEEMSSCRGQTPIKRWNCFPSALSQDKNNRRK